MIFARLLMPYTHCAGAGHGRDAEHHRRRRRVPGRGNIGNPAAALSKTLEKREPKKKKPRMEKPDASNEDLGLGFFIDKTVKRAGDQSRKQLQI